jgi:hypothetical protein
MVFRSSGLLVAVLLASSLSVGQARAAVCSTLESRDRGVEAMRPFLQWPTTDAPTVEGRVALDCIARNRKLGACRVVSASASPYPLVKAAFAYAREIALCDDSSGPMPLVIDFSQGGGEEAAPK